MRLAPVLLLLAACASDPMRGPREAYLAGRYQEAEQQLDKLRSGSDRHRFALEQAVVTQALQRPKRAVELLRGARDRMDDLEEGSTLADIAQVLSDDRSRVWAGSDYERVMVRALLGCFDLMQGGHDAQAYGLQVLEKQEQLIRSFELGEGQENPKQNYKLVAFGNYLRAILNEGETRGRNQALREYRKVLEMEPGCSIAQAGVERMETGRFAEEGLGVIHVLSLVGRAPYLVQVEERATRDAMALAELIWAIGRDRPFVPNFAPVPIPALAFYENNPGGCAVFLNGERVADTEVITDIEACAKAEFDAMRPLAMARAVVRRLLKTVVAEAGNEIVENNVDRHGERALIQFGIGLLKNLWTATEAADLRSWQFLPASCQAARIELPAGEHELSIQATVGGRPVGEPQVLRVKVFAGYPTYVLALTPSQRGGPVPMASRTVDPDTR